MPRAATRGETGTVGACSSQGEKAPDLTLLDQGETSTSLAEQRP